MAAVQLGHKMEANVIATGTSEDKLKNTLDWGASHYLLTHKEDSVSFREEVKELTKGKGAESGYIYGEACGGWMTPKDKLKPHKHFKDEQWNTYRVLAQGARIQVWINDQQISDLTHEEKFKSHPKGFIGLQVHSIRKDSGPFEVRWRNLEIIELK